MIFFVSPTEHHADIRSLGSVSRSCEDNGVDVLALSDSVRVGFQRKAASDFFASVLDGRLSFELKQIQSSQLLTAAVLILEGRFDFTTDGQSTIPHCTINRDAYRSLLTSIQLQGVTIAFSDSPSDTAHLVRRLGDYFAKGSHQSLLRRPNPRNQWGRTTSRGFSTHLLQSFPGVGPELADKIYEHFGHCPIGWTVTADDLRRVPGIGPKRAVQLVSALTVGGDAG